MTHQARLIACAAVLAYLGGDFFVFNGPLNRSIQAFHPDSPQSLEKARANGVVARVGQRSISNSQLERATLTQLWLQGKTPAGISGDEQQTLRRAALDELIEHEILRNEIAGLETPPAPADGEIDERLQRLAARFETKERMTEAMKSQGIPSEKFLRERLAADIRARKFIESKIAADIQVTDAEAKQWFEGHLQDLGTPERLEARHVFIATLETPPEEAKKKLDEALAALSAKQKDFATLAKELSQDPASKDAGGNLWWMTRQRLSPDFAEPVFSLAVGQPALIRTKLGWHLVEVTGRKGAEPANFDSAKPEIVAALGAAKRRTAVTAYRRKLREAAAAEVRILDPRFAS